MACHLYLTIKPRTRAKRTRARLIVANMGGAMSTSHFAYAKSLRVHSLAGIKPATLRTNFFFTFRRNKLQNMCLYPRLIKNPRYKGRLYDCDDARKLFVAIGCGNCYECRKQKAQGWRVRLMEELKCHKHAYFLTLTFSPENLQKLCDNYELKECNAVCGKALRMALERYRKLHKHSIKHWFITELGHEETERIHLHGIIFDNEQWNNERVEKWWTYGNTFTGDYCNERTINYVVKYILKIDLDHKDYKSEIFCSPGLGASYCNNIFNKQRYKYIQGQSDETYTMPNGYKVALPIYMRNKFYTEQEREKIWTDRLDKAEMYVNGIRCPKVNTIKGLERYKKTLLDMQKWNKKLGYGDLSKEWKAKDYNVTLRMLNKIKK